MLHRLRRPWASLAIDDAQNIKISIELNQTRKKKRETPSINPFKTAVSFWVQTPPTSSSLSPKRDSGSKWVKHNTTKYQIVEKLYVLVPFKLYQVHTNINS